MNDMQIFNNQDFGSIRSVIIDDVPWFVAKDVSEALGYTSPSSMRKLIDDDDKQNINSSILEQQVVGQTRQIGIINESGLYSAIINSTLSGAKKFKRWVTSEVLPAIRKTGSYSSPALPQNTDAAISLLARGHQELRQDVEKMNEDVRSVRQDLEDFKMDLPLFPADMEEITKAVNRKVVNVLGGKTSNAYRFRGTRSQTFQDVYREIHRQFGCNTYKSIPRRHISAVLNVINDYELPYTVKEDIDRFNAQQRH